ncbi:MAG: 5'-methylthioadenosine/S-adenosylhomocysteine nucleosidase [Clostridiaceae bacterium]|nr:5'-methylthioadenosine/S-adenosylhomocysteine nucleosidase [Clostridiaceae bacterium]
MIYIHTALSIEASPLIDGFKLKKDMDVNEFQVFGNEDMMMIISGVGKVKSAMALSYLFGKYGVCEKDILLNIGYCGSSSDEVPLGMLMLANKVVDMDTGREYFPDLFLTGYRQRCISCFSNVVKRSTENTENIFVDMESAGVMEASYKFLYPHQTVIVKIVSDYLDDERKDVSFLKSLMTENLSNIEDIIKQAKEIAGMTKGLDMAEEYAMLERISENMRFTKGMMNLLRPNVRKAKIKGYDTIGILHGFLDRKSSSRIERKRVFDELLKKLK